MAKFVVLHDTLVLNMIYFQHRRIQCFRLTEMMLCNHIMLLWIRTKIINLHHHTRTRAMLLWVCLLHIQITDDAKSTFAICIILNYKNNIDNPCDILSWKIQSSIAILYMRIYAIYFFKDVRRNILFSLFETSSTQFNISVLLVQITWLVSSPVC